MTALTVTIRSWPRTASPDQVYVDVACSTGSGPLKTRASVTFTDLERDYLNTLVEDVVSTYMYGETPRDLARSVASVAKLARAHQRKHGM